MNSKRGQFTDIIVLVLTLFFVAVGFIFISHVYTSVGTALNSTGIFNTTEQQNAFGTIQQTGTKGINEAFLILFGGLIIVQLVTSYIVRYNPIFIIIFLVMLVINVLLAVYLGNAFDEFTISASSTTLANAFAEQPVITWVWSHIIAIAVVIDILSIIVLFAKVGEVNPV